VLAGAVLAGVGTSVVAGVVVGDASLAGTTAAGAPLLRPRTNAPPRATAVTRPTAMPAMNPDRRRAGATGEPQVPALKRVGAPSSARASESVIACLRRGSDVARLTPPGSRKG
jgi:hypothetical protein